MNKKQKEKLKDLCQKYHFYFCVLFGSGIRKPAFQRDYDLAFFSPKPLPGDLKLKIFDQLQPLFDKPVDIVLIQPYMDPLLAYEISTRGKLIFELKEDSFLEFQGRAWKDYLDTQRYRDYEKEYIKKKVKDVS